jgi:hypothetical protein
MSTRVRKKDDDFKKRKIFWKNIAENFPPHITAQLSRKAYRRPLYICIVLLPLVQEEKKGDRVFESKALMRIFGQVKT